MAMRRLWVYKFEEKKIMQPSFVQSNVQALDIEVDIRKDFFWFSLVPIHLFHLNLPSLALSDAATPLFLIYVIIYLLFFVYIIFI